MEWKFADTLAFWTTLIRKGEAASRICMGEIMGRYSVGDVEALFLGVLGSTDGECVASDIARQLGLSKAALSRAVEKLSVLGYISQERDMTDRRRVLLRLEPPAGEVLDALAKGFDEMYEGLTDGISAQEMETVERVMRQMCDNVIKIADGGHK